MDISEHPEARRLFISLCGHTDAATAETVSHCGELPLNAGPEQRARWVRLISAELEKRFDEDTVKNIRQGCFCTEDEEPGKNTASGYLCADAAKFRETLDWLKGLWASAGNLETFVDAANEFGVDWFVKDGVLYTKYIDCECPMLEHISRLPSKTWCHCTAGYNKRLFREVFGREVDVEVLESIKLGSDICLMKITTREA